MKQFLQKLWRKELKIRRNCLRSGVAVLLLHTAIFQRSACAQAAELWPDTFLARVEALALVETLNATLLAARSATFTLAKCLLPAGESMSTHKP
jgi:hypothetical protein